MISGVLNSARKGRQSQVKSITGATYGGGWGPGAPWGIVNQSGLDFQKEAGLRWDNSIVYSILSFAAQMVNSVPLMVATVDDNGTVTPVHDSPALAILVKPNDWYDGTLLTTGSVFMEGSVGNSYTYKHRSKGGKLIALELLPQGTTYPYTYPGSGDWISEYRIATASGYYAVPPKDVVHMRWMTVNPLWPQLGMSPIDSALPELVADKNATKLEGALVTNSGVSPQAIFPKTWPENVDGELTESQATQIQDKIKTEVSGGGAGNAIVFTVPLEVKQLGFDPSQLALNGVHDFSEERVCSVFHIPPVILGLGTGLDKSNNRASFEAAVDVVFDLFILPYLAHRALQLTESIIPELGQEGQVFLYDLSKVPALKERLVRQIMIATGGPVETPNEGRAKLNMKPLPDGDTLRTSKPDTAETNKVSSDK